MLTPKEKQEKFKSFKKAITPELIQNWLGLYTPIQILQIFLKPLFEVSMTTKIKYELKCMVLETLNDVFDKLDRQRIGAEILDQITDL